MADDGVIRLRVGNNGTTVSPLTKVEFFGLEKLVLGNVTTTKGTLEGSIWNIGTLWRNEIAEITIEATSSEYNTVIVTAQISGKNPDLNQDNNRIELDWSAPVDVRVTTNGDVRVTTSGDTRIRRNGI